jgi:hypothetical protein
VCRLDEERSDASDHDGEIADDLPCCGPWSEQPWIVAELEGVGQRVVGVSEQANRRLSDGISRIPAHVYAPPCGDPAGNRVILLGIVIGSQFIVQRYRSSKASGPDGIMTADKVRETVRCTRSERLAR